MVCKAKTGTGKTLAFLIPAIERILAAQAQGRQGQPGDIAALILSPSRELAMQISAEAGQLLKFHDIRAEVREPKLSLTHSLTAQAQDRGDIAALILSPSRELAKQITAEAGQLLKFHDIRAEVHGLNHLQPLPLELRAASGSLRRLLP